jgi:hypothetical protein
MVLDNLSSLYKDGEIYAFLLGVMKMNPRDRPTATQLLEIGTRGKPHRNFALLERVQHLTAPLRSSCDVPQWGLTRQLRPGPSRLLIG